MDKNLHDTSNESLHKNKGNRATSLNGLELPAFPQGQALPGNQATALNGLELPAFAQGQALQGNQATSLNGPELPAFGQGEAIPGNQATSLNGLELGCMFLNISLQKFHAHLNSSLPHHRRPSSCCISSGSLSPKAVAGFPGARIQATLEKIQK